MTAGANDEERLKFLGCDECMVAGHAYSLLGCYEINDEKIVKLRNPWGKFEWNGPWCDADLIWKTVSNKKKHEMGYSHRDDGTFFMKFESFRKIYSDLEICMVEDDYDYVSLGLKTRKHQGVYVEVEVKSEGEYFFTILQPSCRKMNNPNYKYSQAKIVLAQRNNDDLVYINAKQYTHREVFIQNNLKVGKYVIYCKVNWDGFDEGSFVLSSYGYEPVIFKKIDKIPDFSEKVYMSKALNSDKKSSYEGFKVSKAVEFLPQEGYGYFFIDNKEDKDITSKVVTKKMSGVRPKKNVKISQNNNFDINVPANSRKIMIFNIDKKEYNFDFDEEIIF